jgi:hypothetical protein
MLTWDLAASAEAQAMRAWRDHGVLPELATHLELRIATIGMYATVYLLEDEYDYELPRGFHAHPRVRRIKRCANELVGLGNDIFSFGKDLAEGQINLITTLMAEERLPGDIALERLIRLHNSVVGEFDALAATLGSWGPEADAHIARWLDDVRYASVGFTRWEAQAPRYTAHKVVFDGRVIEPVIEPALELR